MYIIRTSEDFRDTAMRVRLLVEDLIPEPHADGHWSLQICLSIDDLGEDSQALLKSYQENYHPTVINHYKEKEQRLDFSRPPKLSWIWTNFQVQPNEAVIMIVLENPQIPQFPQNQNSHDVADKNALKGQKHVDEATKNIVTSASTDVVHIPAGFPLKKLREKADAAIVKSFRPPSGRPFDLAVGDILALDEGEAIFLKAGGVSGFYIPFDVQRVTERNQNHPISQPAPSS